MAEILLASILVYVCICMHEELVGLHDYTWKLSNSEIGRNN